MTSIKKIAIAVLFIGAVFVGFAIWYKYQFSMTLAETYELNTNTAHSKLLIATQGSEFKDKITAGVIEGVKHDSLYIKVIDISALRTINPQRFNALLIMHTWENWKAPKSVESFITRSKPYQDKIVVFTTSGDGTYKMEDVDAITGESRLQDVNLFVEEITNRLHKLL